MVKKQTDPGRMENQPITQQLRNQICPQTAVKRLRLDITHLKTGKKKTLFRFNKLSH